MESFYTGPGSSFRSPEMIIVFVGFIPHCISLHFSSEMERWCEREGGEIRCAVFIQCCQLCFSNSVNCVSLNFRWKGGIPYMKEAGDTISCISLMLSVVFLKFRQLYFSQF